MFSILLGRDKDYIDKCNKDILLTINKMSLKTSSSQSNPSKRIQLDETKKG